MLAAIQQLITAIAPDAIAEDTIDAYLYTKDLPDPDLIIRHLGEHRLSNFLLWQSAYSELYFTPVLWPDLVGPAFPPGSRRLRSP